MAPKIATGSSAPSKTIDEAKSLVTTKFPGFAAEVVQTGSGEFAAIVSRPADDIKKGTKEYLVKMNESDKERAIEVLNGRVTYLAAYSPPASAKLVPFELLRYKVSHWEYQGKHPQARWIVDQNEDWIFIGYTDKGAWKTIASAKGDSPNRASLQLAGELEDNFGLKLQE